MVLAIEAAAADPSILSDPETLQKPAETPTPTTIIVVLSGGQDSTTCLYMAAQRCNKLDRVHCLTFDYGQAHNRELHAAHLIVQIARGHFPHLIIDHEVIEVPNVLKGTSPLVRGGRALERYENWDALPGGIEKTFVPMRNQLFLTIAANRAVIIGAGLIVTGVSEEDYGGYPDCRDGFIHSLEETINLSLDGVSVIQIGTPLMFKSKAETVALAKQIPGCWEALSVSHTGYDNAYPPTGKDHATLLRAKGFAEAGEADPAIVRAWRLGHMELPTTSNYDSYRNPMQ